MNQSYGGIFTIPVLSFQMTLACVKVTQTTQHTQSLSLWPRETCNLRSFTAASCLPRDLLFPFYLLTVVHLSNFRYLWGKGRDSFELRRSWQVWWCSKSCVSTQTLPLHNILLCYELGLDTFRFDLTVRSHKPLSHPPFLSESNYLHVAECRGEKFSWNLNKTWKKGHMFVKLSKHPHFLFSFFLFRVWTFD